MALSRSSSAGQSIVEVLVAIGIGAIFIIGAATIIAPSLLISKQSGLAQTKTELATELLNNTKTWAAGNWNGLLALATSSANAYYLNTSSSPFTVATGTQTIFIAAVSSTRYFYLSDVYRDSSGNVTSTTSGNNYDPSTKQITVIVNGTINGAPTSTIVSYVTRNISNVFDQTDWSGGPGLNGPVTVTNNQFAASAGIDYTSVPGSLLAVALTNSAWPNGYTYRRAITVASSLVAPSGSVLTNFPMLISGTYSYLAASSSGGNIQNANGYDLIFTSDASGTMPLSYERESYASSTGAVNYWVNVPTLSSSSNVIYMFYGNSSISTDQSSATTTWNSSYVGVWHLPNGTTLTANDSTANRDNGTLINSPTATSSVINGGAAFSSASSQDITANTVSSLGGSSKAVLSGWFRRGAALQAVGWGEDSGSKGTRFSIYAANGSNGVNVYAENSAGIDEYGSFTSNDTSWHQVVMVYDGTQSGNASRLVAYLDGVPQTLSFTGTIPATLNSTSTFYFGRSPSTFAYSNGALDEVELMTGTTVSSDWVVTEFNSQSNPATFYSIGSATLGSNSGGGSIVSTAGQHWAWNDKIGWIDFYDTNTVSVTSAGLTGYASSSVGDISFDCATTRAGNICNGGNGGSPYSNGYTHRRTITVASNLVAPSGSVLTNFPMLISGTYSDLATAANGGVLQNANGYDLIFTSDASGTMPLSYERESYASSTGAVNYWVNVPTLSSSSNVIYMFYGNSSISTDQSSATTTWNSSYVGVWHLADNAANTTVKDSTGNNNTGTAAANTNTKTITGNIGSALAFNGSTDYIYTANSFTNPQTETIQIWFKTNSTAGTKLIGFENNQSGTGSTSYDRQIWVGTDGKVYGGFYNADYPGSLVSAGTYNDNNWHLADLVYSSTTQQDYLYVDGNQVGSTISDTSGPQIVTGYYRIGGYKLNSWTNANDGYFNGSLEEARVSNIARSADWIKTEYNNQSNPSTFYSMGSPTTNGGYGGQYQVVNDSLGDLSGWAWNDKYGWISFCGGQNSTNCPGSVSYQVTIDSSGNFQGWAWNDVVGWIDFNCDNNSSCGTSNYEVKTTWTAGSSGATASTLDSPTFDTGVASGAQFNSIAWQGSLSSGSTVQFQFAVSNSSGGPWNFAGTDGTSNTYYTPSAPGIPVNLNYNAFNGYRYFRYRVAITYANATSSRVDDVIVNWSP